MNKIFLMLGIESWKPLLSAVFVSPLPLIVMVLVGALLMSKRQPLAWVLILFGCVSLWISTTTAGGELLRRYVLRPPPEPDAAGIAQLTDAPDTAIVVLGGGTVDRLRYGIWLARTTNLPVAFSAGRAEAAEAAHVAEHEFGFKLRWREDQSRDTRENAINTVALLQPRGIRQIVLIGNGVDMPRAVRNFERASRGMGFRIVPAPMGEPTGYDLDARDWLPYFKGYQQTWEALHECVGLLAGA